MSILTSLAKLQYGQYDFENITTLSLAIASLINCWTSALDTELAILETRTILEACEPIKFNDFGGFRNEMSCQYQCPLTDKFDISFIVLK